MATTEVDIANLALAHIGNSGGITSLDEASVAAAKAKRFYPIARDTLLEMHAWKFAIRRQVLAERADLANTAWAYVYEEPANCLRVLGVLPDGYSDDIRDAQEYVTESSDTGLGLILTNVSGATGRYVFRQTNTVRFTPLFVESLGWLLASALAGQLIKGDTGRQAGLACWQSFLLMFARAAGSSASQTRMRPIHTPDWISARGVSVSDQSWPLRNA